MHRHTNVTSEAYFALCKQANTPYSLGAWIRFRDDHKSFLELDINPGNYMENQVDLFKLDYAVSAYLSKYKGLDVDVDKDEVALGRFTTSEQACSDANKRLSLARRLAITPELSGWLYTAKKSIAKLLGPFSLHKIEPFFEWGPGATFDIPRRRAHPDTKLVTTPITVARKALGLARELIQRDLHWSEALLGVMPEGAFSLLPHIFKSVETCRVETVPKNSKTNRVIAVEPTMNLYIQKGVGGYFRARLKSVGIDLDDQGVNQVLCSRALQLSLATIDLKMASDSMCRELVYELLPYEWWSFLDTIRSAEALLPSKSVIRLNKFSSMGNGFTFELESLIFWALVSAVSGEGKIFSVYGDDIICEKQVASDVIQLLGFVGFQTNEEKSFVDGLFYESCGEHYFNGILVTPPYQKEVYDQQTEYFRAHNRLVRWAARVNVETHAHKPFFRAADSGFSRCYLPLGAESDDGFLVDTTTLVAAAKGFCPNRGWRVAYAYARKSEYPVLDSAYLANSLRRSWIFGDVAPSPQWVNIIETREGDDGRCKLELEQTMRKHGVKEGIPCVSIGYRWVIPAGVSPIRTR